MLNRFGTVNWYYIDRGQKTGPLADAQLDELVRAGQLTPDSLVWQEGMTEWQPYGRVRSVPAPAAPGRGTGRKTCALCSESFPLDEMIAFDDAWVCASCKPLLVQRVREGLSVGHASGDAWRDGDLVVTMPGSSLTGRCVKCNGVESLSDSSSTLDWHPPRWVHALPARKRPRVAFSICRHHRNQRSMWSVASWFIVLIACGLGAAAVVSTNVVLMAIAVAMLGGAAIGFLRLWMPLSVAKIEGDYVWLRGCGREFIDALPEFNLQRALERQNSAEPPNRKT